MPGSSYDEDYLPPSQRTKPKVPAYFTKEYVLLHVAGWESNAIGHIETRGSICIAKTGNRQAVVMLSRDPFTNKPSINDIRSGAITHMARAIVSWKDGQPECGEIKASGE